MSADASPPCTTTSPSAPRRVIDETSPHDPGAVPARRTRTSSHSPITTASTFSFSSVARGVVDAWGPTPTNMPPTARARSAASICIGTRSSGGAQRQNRYDGALVTTVSSGANAATCPASSGISRCVSCPSKMRAS